MSDFLSEVQEQPEALARLLGYYADAGRLLPVRDLMRPRGSLVFTGMGASLYASIPAATYLASLGKRVQVLEAGELAHFGWPSIARRSTLVIAVSQSGESHETVELARVLREAVSDLPIVAVTNAPESKLARLATLNLPVLAGAETATSSKTYVNSIALLLLLATALARGTLAAMRRRLAPLPKVLAASVHVGLATAKRVADFLEVDDYLPLVARGPSLASALHGALVLKEAAALGAEGFTGGGFRHGPYEMAGPALRAVIFASGRTAALSVRLATNLAGLGARVALISDQQQPAAPRLLPIRIEPVDELVAPILEILPMQALAIELARRRGRQPGVLHISGKVVSTEV